ncbi:MAG: hypothetical protein ACD_37C00124G0001, partial [uncultured bacterium]
MAEELLPKPFTQPRDGQTDLPLPEKELPAHATVKEEPVNLPQKQTNIGTPAHPFPTFLPKKLAILALILIGLIFAAGVAFKYFEQRKLNAITDFETCAAAGYPVAESYPASCRTSDGRSFTQILSEEEKKKINTPDLTADWQVYSGDYYSFKYPKSWIPYASGEKQGAY